MKKKEKILLGAVFLIVILLSLCSNKKILEGMDHPDEDEDEEENKNDKKDKCNKDVDDQDYVGKFHDKDDHYCVYKLT